MTDEHETLLERARAAAVGTRVRYVPGYAAGDATHDDCMDGTIVSVGRTCVRVRFDKYAQRLGPDVSHVCNPKHLRLLLP